MAYNKCILIGRLVADPEMRTTQSGVNVCQFRIAVDRSYSKDKEADFLTVVAWRKTAEFIGQYFTKGKEILVEGSIQSRTYDDKNGQKRTAVEIVADNVGFVGSKNSSAPAQTQLEDDGGDDDLPF